MRGYRVHLNDSLVPALIGRVSPVRSDRHARGDALHKYVGAEHERDPAAHLETPPPKGQRCAVSLALGLAAASLFLFMTRVIVYQGATDFEFWWRGSRLWLSSVDPYLLVPYTPQWPLADRLYYPMPALLVTAPLARLDMRIAGACFVGVGSAWLCWTLTATAMWRLWFFATPAFIMAVRLGQWSPIVTAAALVPAAGFFLVMKPTLGAAAFVYRPTWRGAIGVALVLALSVVILPEWPREWIANLHAVRSHPPPIMTPLGWLLPLAFIRWRQPEARLLLAMAIVPQLLFFADQLALGLVARTKHQAEFFAACGLAAAFAWLVQLQPFDPNMTGLAGPYVMLGCYLPALVIVLRRPNEGDVPRWLNILAARLGSLLPHPTRAATKARVS